MQDAFAAFAEWSQGWLRISEGEGAGAVLAAYGRVLGGETPPDVAEVVTLSARALLERDPLEDVRDPLAGVDRLLERLEDVLPADHDHRVDAVREQLRDGGAADLVGLVLEPVDLDQVPAEVHPVAQLVQRGGHLGGGGDRQLGDLLGLLHRRLDPVAAELVGGLLGEVDDVVERDRERVHVGRVQVGAPALLGQAAEDRVREPVALLLALVEPADLLLGVRHGGERVAQQRDAALGVGAGALEQLEQLRVRCGVAVHPLAP